MVVWPQAEKGLTKMGGAPPPRWIPRRRDVLGGKAGVGQREDVLGAGVLEGRVQVRGGVGGVRGGRRPGGLEEKQGKQGEVLGHPGPVRGHCLFFPENMSENHLGGKERSLRAPGLTDTRGPHPPPTNQS